MNNPSQRMNDQGQRLSEELSGLVSMEALSPLNQSNMMNQPQPQPQVVDQQPPPEFQFQSQSLRTQITPKNQHEILMAHRIQMLKQHEMQMVASLNHGQWSQSPQFYGSGVSRPQLSSTNTNNINNYWKGNNRPRPMTVYELEQQNNMLESRVNDQDTNIAQLKQENLNLKERLHSMERQLGELRTKLLPSNENESSVGGGSRDIFSSVLSKLNLKEVMVRNETNAGSDEDKQDDTDTDTGVVGDALGNWLMVDKNNDDGDDLHMQM